MKLDTFVNSALFCFTKGLVLRNTIQWRTTWLSTCIFCSFGLMSLIYSVKPWVRICYGVEHSKRLKHLVTRGYLIKRPARWQCVKQHGNRAAKWHCGPSSVNKLHANWEDVRKDYKMYRNTSTLDMYCKI